MEHPDLRIEAARYVLGELLSDDAVRIADRLLNLGAYSAATDELASLRQPVAADVRPLFERVLRDSGVVLPSRDAAVDLLLCFYIGQIAAGTVVPRHGLQLVQGVYAAAEVPVVPMAPAGASHGLHDLLRCYYSYDEPLAWPAGSSEQDATAALDAEAIGYARLWLAARCA